MILTLKCKQGEYRIAMRGTSAGFAVVEAGFAASPGCDPIADVPPECRKDPLRVWESMVRNIDWIGSSVIRESLKAQGFDPWAEDQPEQMTIEAAVADGETLTKK